MTKKSSDFEGWVEGSSLPTKKGDYLIRLSTPGANPPYIEVEVVWNGKAWREDGQFTVPNESVAYWKAIG